MLWDPEILASVRACLLVFFRVFSWCCFQLFRQRSRGNLWKRSNWSLVGTAKGVIFTLSFIVRTTLRLPVRLVKHKMLSCEENKYIECCAINCDCSPAHLHWTDRLGNDGADIFEVHWAPGPEFWFRVSIWFSFSLPISILFSLFFFLCRSLQFFFSFFLVLFRTMCHHIILMWTFYFMFVRIWRTHRIFMNYLNIIHQISYLK